MGMGTNFKLLMVILYCFSYRVIMRYKGSGMHILFTAIFHRPCIYSSQENLIKPERKVDPCGYCNKFTFVATGNW